MDVISFPLFKIKFMDALPDETILMLLGGRRASSEWLSSLRFYQSCWAIDSGVETCRAAGIIPDRLIGDGDSASAESWSWAKENGADIHSYGSEKDLTDFQLALELLSGEPAAQPKGVFLSNAFGGRFDHLESVVCSFAGWSDKYIPIGMADEKEALFILRGGGAEIEFYRSPEVVSLIPFTDSREVSISGVRWPLENVVLERFRPYSVSNRPDAGNRIRACAGEGLVGLYCAWSGAGE